MQRGLSVEDDIVVIVQVTLDGVAYLEVLICAILKDCEIDIAAINTFDVLGTGPVVSTAINQSLQVLIVVLGDDLWHCEVHSDLNGHSKLV